jgi:hypothetical protein
MSRIPLYECKQYHALPCELELFKVKGKDAKQEEFVICSSESDDNYGCSSHTAHAKMPTEEILQKYNLSLKEYGTVATAVAVELTFGGCGWCS